MAEKKIDGILYRYDRIPATESLPLLLRLLKIVGPAKNIIMAVAEDDELKKDAVAYAAIMEMITTIDPLETTALVREVIGHCRADGEPAVFGVKPQGLEESLKVLFFALQVEFGGFFAGGLELAGLKPRKDTPVSAPKK